MSKINLRIISKSIYKVYAGGGGGGGGGLREEHQSNEQCRQFPFFFFFIFFLFFEIEIHSADKIYVFVGGNV